MLTLQIQFYEKVKTASIFQEVEKFTASADKKVSVGVTQIFPSFPHAFNQSFILSLAKMWILNLHFY